MKTVRVLILEDDLETLSVIMRSLFELEESFVDSKIHKDFAVTVFSEYTEVQSYLNARTVDDFDIIILDKDCKLAGSFHVLDFDIFSPSKVIAISTNVEYNQAVEARGVRHVCRKDYQDLDRFGVELVKEIKSMLVA